jgi:hypothetical protein
MGKGSQRAAPGLSNAAGSLHVSTPIQSPSWELLRTLRCRGQRPTGGIWITDDKGQQTNLAAGAMFAVGLPLLDEAYLVSGLGVSLIATQSIYTIEVAHALASSGPILFVIYWRGEGLWRLVG